MFKIIVINGGFILLITICITICLLIIISALFYPEMKIGKAKIETFWAIALIGAILLISLGFIKPKTVLESFFSNTSVNPIKILILFISMTGLSVFLDEIGFFNYLAQIALKNANTSQKMLFVYLYFTVSFLTIFTSNDIIILTLTPFICYFCKKADISPIPYLVAEFVAANTWSMTLIIGNPTNIYIATSFGIDFLKYIKIMLLPTIFAGLVSYLILRIIFNNALQQSITHKYDITKIKNKPLLITGLIHLSLCTIILAVSSYIGLEMWLISLLFFISLIISVIIICRIQKKPNTELNTTIKRLPWNLIPFVLSMFVLVIALSENGITEYLCTLIDGKYTELRFGLASYLSANIINNIPMSVLFVFIIQSLDTTKQLSAVFTSIIGSNIGAYLTPIGALAGIMWTSILKKLDVKFSLFDFIKYGIIVSVPTIITAIGILMLII